MILLERALANEADFREYISTRIVSGRKSWKLINTMLARKSWRKQSAASGGMRALDLGQGVDANFTIARSFKPDTLEGSA